MKFWLLGIGAAVVLLVGLPAATLALADDPTPAVTTNGPGLGPAHDNHGHHYGWSKGHHGRSDHDSDSGDGGRGGPPPWAHGTSKGAPSSHHHGPPPWSRGKHTGTD